MITEKQEGRYWQGIAETGSVTKAAKLAGFGHSKGYELKAKQPERFESAYNEYLDNLRDKFEEFALDGIWEEVAFQGVVGAKRKKISPQLLIKLVESKLPEYKPRQAIEHSGRIEYDNLTDDELQQKLEQLRGSTNG